MYKGAISRVKLNEEIKKKFISRFNTGKEQY